MSHLFSSPRLCTAAVTLALAGTLALSAQAAPGGQGMGGPAHMMAMGHDGMMSAGSMMGGMLPQMLDRVNATPEQRAQVKQIMEGSAREMQAQHEAGRALRTQMLGVFTLPTVDASLLEVLRQKQLALQDARSKRMLSTMLEISRVLTPEQRKQIAESLAQRSEMMQRHRRERQAIDAPKS